MNGLIDKIKIVQKKGMRFYLKISNEVKFGIQSSKVWHFSLCSSVQDKGNVFLFSVIYLKSMLIHYV